jgi:solute carrier family 25 carnitine/acylcarnitine transporter 20/29
VDLFKIKLQSQVGRGEYEGVLDAGRKILGRYGLAGAYQGLSATMLRNFPSFGTYFLGSELGYRMVNPHFYSSKVPLGCVVSKDMDRDWRRRVFEQSRS